MALLHEINNGTQRFSVDDAGAIKFNNAFTFPTADGTANYVLKTNGSGTVSWSPDANTGTVTGTGAANRVTYWDSATNVTSDAGFTYNGAGRVNTDESFGVSKDGADTTADGPFFRLTNAAATRQYLWQLDASNNIDYWYYNGSTWTPTISLLTDGGATFAGNVTGTTASFTRLDINASNTKLKGDLLGNADAAYDIGASGANRPRNLYLSNSITAGDITTTGVGIFGGSITGTTATFSGSVTAVGISSTIASATSGYFATSTAIPANQILHVRDNVGQVATNSAGGIKISSSPGNDVFLLKRNDGGNSYFALQNSSASEFITVNMASGFVGIGQTSPQFNIHSGTAVAIPNSRYLNFAGTGTSEIAYSNFTKALVFSANDSAATSQPKSIGIILHNQSTTDNNFTPLLAFGAQSNSTNYSAVVAGIAAKRLETASDSNWSGGELWFWTARDGTAFEGSTAGLPATPVMVMNTSRNVGIGTTSPINRLVVKGLFAAPLTTGSVQNGIARFSQTSGVGSLDIGFGDPYSWLQSRSSSNYATNYNLALQPNGGNVGIGTDSPGYKLDVSGNIKSSTLTVYDGMGGTETGIGASSAGGNLRLYAGGTNKVTVSNTAQSLILYGNSTTGSNYIQLNDSAGTSQGYIGYGSSGNNIFYFVQFKAAAFNFYLDGAVRGAISTAGTLTMQGDVIAYGSPSDKRLKENIKPIESALDKVSKLQGVTFDWKEKEKEYDQFGKPKKLQEWKNDIGFIAQDVQKVIPELVRENEDGMLSMRHQGIAPILLEAIKELKAEIEELKLNKCNCNCNK